MADPVSEFDPTTQVGAIVTSALPPIPPEVVAELERDQHAASQVTNIPPGRSIADLLAERNA